MAEPTWDKSRVEPFSDGVLAIAITLLVLEIRLPEDTRGHLPRALRELWPSYSAYLRSFLVIGIMWANHHSLFRLIARCDEGLLFTNVVLLATISFLPFPTAVRARALRAGAGDDRTAALLLYGGTSVVIALAYNLVWHYARLRGLLVPGLAPSVVARMTRGYLVGPVLYAAAMLVAPLSAAASMALWLGLALFFLRGSPRPAFTRGAAASTSGG